MKSVKIEGLDLNGTIPQTENAIPTNVNELAGAEDLVNTHTEQEITAPKIWRGENIDFENITSISSGGISAESLDKHSGSSCVAMVTGDTIGFHSIDGETTKEISLQPDGVLSVVDNDGQNSQTSNIEIRNTGNDEQLAYLSDIPTNFTTQEIETICDDIFYPALPAPTNVIASGTDITFDDVQGAESYVVYANGNEIGEVQA